MKSLALGLLTFLATAVNALEIYGHRGASALVPENTLHAIQTAFDLGCTGVEFDIHLTQDGTIIILHDSTLERTAYYNPKTCTHTQDEFARIVTTPVTQLTYNEIATIDLDPNAQHHVPTLKQALQMLPQINTMPSKSNQTTRQSLPLCKHC